MPKNKKTAFYYFAKEYAERTGCNINEAVIQTHPQ